MPSLPTALTFPNRVLNAPGSATTLLKECAAFGTRGMLVHGHSLAASGALARLIEAAPPALRVTTWTHPGGEPTLAQVEAAIAAARACRAEWIAAVGGGSVMDVGKACAGLLTAPHPVAHYHAGADIPPARMPFIAAPTTAGTGGEATGVTVLTDPALNVKKSIRHPSFTPRVVVLDAELLAGCPPATIAASGMDAFVQAVESFFSKGATFFSDSLALAAMGLVNANLPAVFRGATGLPAQQLIEGSFMAGLALSHARLGLVHGLAHPLGLRHHAAHGLVCAICLPPVLAFNRTVAAERYAILTDQLGEDLIAHTQNLLAALQLASPFRGQPLRDRDAIIAETLASGSTAANPRAVTAADVSAILDVLFAC